MSDGAQAPVDFRDVARRALRRIEILEARLEQERRGSSVAIVGMGCRFPAAATPDALWSMLRRGDCAIGPVPGSRWTVDDILRLGGRTEELPGIMAAGLLDEPDGFDPDFFGLSPREAETLDPQQRLLLEVGWEALEDACAPPERLPRERTGVFVGISGIDYALEAARVDSGEVDPFVTTGSAHSVASGRLAYVWGLGGPAVSVDTACSSSAMAIHLARQSLLSNDCDVALAGGVGRLLLPHVSLQFARAGMLSRSGHSRPFDQAADGFVRAEGCGVVVLKRLSDAERDGDRIYGVILGSGVSQDGRTSGLTVPHGPSQERAIRSALATAGLAPEDVSYVEAHGTGTRLGDPIELRALARLHAGRRSEPLAVGSIKANLGHLEAAAGVAGVMKAALMTHHRETPATVGLATPTAEFDWGASALAAVRTARPWDPGHRRVVGVSSFGFSGTNVHIVVGEAMVTEGEAVEARPEALVVSGRTPKAADEACERLAAWLRQAPDVALASVAWSAACGRRHFAVRRYVIATSPLEAAVALGRASGPTAGRRAVSAVPSPSQAPFRLGADALGRWPALAAQLERYRAAAADLAAPSRDPARAEDAAHRLAASAFLAMVGARRAVTTSPDDGAVGSSDPVAEVKALLAHGTAEGAAIDLVSDGEGVLGAAQVLDLVGQAYAEGGHVRWDELLSPSRPLSLPTYPFQRRPLLRRGWRPGSSGGGSPPLREIIREPIAASVEAGVISEGPIWLGAAGAREGVIARAVARARDGCRRIAVAADGASVEEVLAAIEEIRSLEGGRDLSLLVVLPKDGAVLDPETAQAAVVGLMRVLRLEDPRAKAGCLLTAMASSDLPPKLLARAYSGLEAAPVLYEVGGTILLERVGAANATASPSQSRGRAWIIGASPIGEALARRLSEAGREVLSRPWEADFPSGDVPDQVFVFLPRARHRGLVNRLEPDAIVADLRDRLRGFRALRRALGPKAVQIVLSRGVESTFGWPGRWLDAAIGQAAASTLEAAAGGAELTVVDWTNVADDAEAESERARIQAHGLLTPDPEWAAGQLLAVAGRGGVLFADTRADRARDIAGATMAEAARAFQRGEVVASSAGDVLLEGLASVLRLSADDLSGVDEHQPLLDLGLDSLLALELARTVSERGGPDLDVQDLLGGASLANLRERCASPISPA